MPSLETYLSDWNASCAYAGECLPDLSPLNVEPWSPLAAIALAAFGSWAIIEYGLQPGRNNRNAR